MKTYKFSVNQCSNNPSRWYVSFNSENIFQLSIVEQALVKLNYKVLTITPSIMVLKSENVRLTWHSHGLIQVDLYDLHIETSEGIEQLINEILVSMSNT
ncbi:MAG: hypothetical protein ACW97X_14825 [Candidatus Hodarchaeales archaeon]